METLVATVLIIVIFLLSSLILNNIFLGQVNSQTGPVETRINELNYLLINEKIETPYAETFNQWDISINSYKERDRITVSFDAIRNAPKTSLNTTIYKDEN